MTPMEQISETLIRCAKTYSQRRSEEKKTGFTNRQRHALFDKFVAERIEPFSYAQMAEYCHFGPAFCRSMLSEYIDSEKLVCVGKEPFKPGKGNGNVKLWKFAQGIN